MLLGVFSRSYPKYAYGKRICVLVLWTLLSQSCLTYYILHLRENRPDYFAEDNRRQMNGRLGPKIPGVCYRYKQLNGSEKSEYLVIYNPPDDPPVSAIAFSRSQVCPEERYALSGRLILAVVLDLNQLEGVHLVNLTALGPDVAFHDATLVSIDPSIPGGDPNRLLANTKNDPRPGVYAWMKKGGIHLFERKRVFFPGNVYRIPDPLDKLKTANQGGRLFYGYLMDLAERYLLSKKSPEDFERSEFALDVVTYEQKLQEYISDILSKGDTSDEARTGRLPSLPVSKAKVRKNDWLVGFVRSLIDAHVEPEPQQSEIESEGSQFTGQDVVQMLGELEELVGPLDDVSSYNERAPGINSPEQEIEVSEGSHDIITESGSGKDVMSSKAQEEEMNSWRDTGHVSMQGDTESHDQPFSDETPELSLGIQEDANEEPQQANSENLPNEFVVDVMAENLRQNIGSPQLSMDSDDDFEYWNPYSYGATSTGRGIDPRRRIPQMEDAFSDPNPLVAGLTDQSQLGRQNTLARLDRSPVSGSIQSPRLDNDEQFEVGPGRRRRSPQNLASQT
ncbi:hypothetical protein TWF506_006958 [Arthrobotrys conoides]|uniref:Uncharacterized protein n=1 Tax=Arthrobotrys conoides TaxID=74498 RepID=A0AAN8RVI1_9PEZI